MVEIFQVSYNVFKQAAQTTTVYYFPITEVSLDGYVLGTGTIDFVYTSKITSPSDVADFITLLFPTSILTELEGDVLALPTIQVNNVESRFDVSGTSFFYIGSAPPGTADSAAEWTIKRFALDAEGNPTDKRITAQNAAVWDDRATETYF